MGIPNRTFHDRLVHFIGAWIYFTQQELLDTLGKGPEETRRQFSEALRKLTMLKVNEKKLTRRYTTLLEQEQHLRKENNKLREESINMQLTVTQRIGYLQRYKVQREPRIISQLNIQSQTYSFNKKKTFTYVKKIQTKRPKEHLWSHSHIQYYIISCDNHICYVAPGRCSFLLPIKICS